MNPTGRCVKKGKARRWRCNCTCAFFEGMCSRPFLVTVPKALWLMQTLRRRILGWLFVLQGTVGEFSGLLSPYNGCSLHNYHTGHSEHEAYTVYLQCYT